MKNQPAPSAEPQIERKARYELSLVVKVASRLLAGRGDEDLVPEVLKRAANNAVTLLDACAERLAADDLIQYQKGASAQYQQAQDKEIMRLSAKFPDGIPWKKGLLLLTGARSEAEAFRPYKQWKLYNLALARLPNNGVALVDPLAEPPEADKALVEQEIAGDKQRGFAPSEIVHARPGYRGWYAEIYVGSEHKKAAKKPRKRKRAQS